MSRAISLPIQVNTSKLASAKMKNWKSKSPLRRHPSVKTEKGKKRNGPMGVEGKTKMAGLMREGKEQTQKNKRKISAVKLDVNFENRIGNRQELIGEERIFDVPGDGHCAYHAFGSQIELEKNRENRVENYEELQAKYRGTAEEGVSKIWEFLTEEEKEFGIEETKRRILEGIGERTVGTRNFGDWIAIRAMATQLRRNVRVILIGEGGQWDRETNEHYTWEAGTGRTITIILCNNHYRGTITEEKIKDIEKEEEGENWSKVSTEKIREKIRERQKKEGKDKETEENSRKTQKETKNNENQKTGKRQTPEPKNNNKTKDRKTGNEKEREDKENNQKRTRGNRSSIREDFIENITKGIIVVEYRNPEGKKTITNKLLKQASQKQREKTKRKMEQMKESGIEITRGRGKLTIIYCKNISKQKEEKTENIDKDWGEIFRQIREEIEERKDKMMAKEEKIIYIPRALAKEDREGREHNREPEHRKELKEQADSIGWKITELRLRQTQGKEESSENKKKVDMRAGQHREILKILSMNVNSLQEETREDKLVRNLKLKQIDMAAIQETKQTKKGVYRVGEYIAIKGKCKTGPQGGRSGGTTWYIHNSLGGRIEETNVEEGNLTWIKLTGGEKYINIYYPTEEHQCERGAILERLEREVDREKRVTIMGDFNTKLAHYQEGEETRGENQKDAKENTANIGEEEDDCPRVGRGAYNENDSKKADEIRELLSRFDLVASCTLKPTKKGEETWTYQAEKETEEEENNEEGKNKTRSKIDYCLTNYERRNTIRKIEMVNWRPTDTHMTDKKTAGHRGMIITKLKDPRKGITKRGPKPKREPLPLERDYDRQCVRNILDAVKEKRRKIRNIIKEIKKREKAESYYPEIKIEGIKEYRAMRGKKGIAKHSTKIESRETENKTEEPKNTEENNTKKTQQPNTNWLFKYKKIINQNNKPEEETNREKERIEKETKKVTFNQYTWFKYQKSFGKNREIKTDQGAKKGTWDIKRLLETQTQNKKTRETEIEITITIGDRGYANELKNKIAKGERWKHIGNRILTKTTKDQTQTVVRIEMEKEDRRGNSELKKEKLTKQIETISEYYKDRNGKIIIPKGISTASIRLNKKHIEEIRKEHEKKHKNLQIHIEGEESQEDKITEKIEENLNRWKRVKIDEIGRKGNRTQKEKREEETQVHKQNIIIEEKKTNDYLRNKYEMIADRTTGDIIEWETNTIRIGEDRYEIKEGKIKENAQWYAKIDGETGKATIRGREKIDEEEAILAIAEKIGKWENPRETKPEAMKMEKYNKIRLARTKTLIKLARKLDKTDKKEEIEEYEYMIQIIKFDKEKERENKFRTNLNRTKREWEKTRSEEETRILGMEAKYMRKTLALYKTETNNKKIGETENINQTEEDLKEEDKDIRDRARKINNTKRSLEIRKNEAKTGEELRLIKTATKEFNIQRNELIKLWDTRIDIETYNEDNTENQQEKQPPVNFKDRMRWKERGLSLICPKTKKPKTKFLLNTKEEKEIMREIEEANKQIETEGKKEKKNQTGEYIPESETLILKKAEKEMLEKKLDELKAQHKEEYWIKELDKATSSDETHVVQKRVYDLVKKAARGEVNRRTEVKVTMKGKEINEKGEENQWTAKTDSEIADKFRQRIQSLFVESSKDKEDTEEEWEKLKGKYKKEPNQETEEYEHGNHIETSGIIDQEELEKLRQPPEIREYIEAIERLKLDKASGEDRMVGEAYKLDPEYWAVKIRDAEMGDIESLSRGWVCYIYKNKGTRESTDYYRPVTVLNVAYKVVTAVHTKRIDAIARAIGLRQFGFRKRTGTRDYLGWFKRMLEENKNGKLTAAYLDLTQAFDRINRKKIWEALLKIGAPWEVVEAIRHIHKQTTMAATWRGTVAKEVITNRGVYQGSPLSPVLFILAMEIVNRRTNNRCTSEGLRGIKRETVLETENIYNIGEEAKSPIKHWAKTKKTQREMEEDEEEIHITSYADDSTLLAEAFGEIQRKIEIFEEEINRVGMQMNKGKTQISTREKQKAPERKAWAKENLNIQNPTGREVGMNAILVGDRINILGSTQPSKALRLEKINRQKGWLIHAVTQTEGLTMKTKLLMLQALIDSITTYSADTSALSERDIEELQKVQDKILYKTVKSELNAELSFKIKRETIRQKQEKTQTEEGEEELKQIYENHEKKIKDTIRSAEVPTIESKIARNKINWVRDTYSKEGIGRLQNELTTWRNGEGSDRLKLWKRKTDFYTAWAKLIRRLEDLELIMITNTKEGIQEITKKINFREEATDIQREEINEENMAGIGSKEIFEEMEKDKERTREKDRRGKGWPTGEDGTLITDVDVLKELIKTGKLKTRDKKGSLTTIGYIEKLWSEIPKEEQSREEKWEIEKEKWKLVKQLGYKHHLETWREIRNIREDQRVSGDNETIREWTNKIQNMEAPDEEENKIKKTLWKTLTYAILDTTQTGREKNYECEECNKKFTSHTALMGHLACHERREAKTKTLEINPFRIRKEGDNIRCVHLTIETMLRERIETLRENKRERMERKNIIWAEGVDDDDSEASEEEAEYECPKFCAWENKDCIGGVEEDEYISGKRCAICSYWFGRNDTIDKKRLQTGAKTRKDILHRKLTGRRILSYDYMDIMTECEHGTKNCEFPEWVKYEEDEHWCSLRYWDTRKAIEGNTWWCHKCYDKRGKGKGTSKNEIRKIMRNKGTLENYEEEQIEKAKKGRGQYAKPTEEQTEAIREYETLAGGKLLTEDREKHLSKATRERLRIKTPEGRHKVGEENEERESLTEEIVGKNQEETNKTGNKDKIQTQQETQEREKTKKTPKTKAKPKGKKEETNQKKDTDKINRKTLTKNKEKKETQTQTKTQNREKQKEKPKKEPKKQAKSKTKKEEKKREAETDKPDMENLLEDEGEMPIRGKKGKNKN